MIENQNRLKRQRVELLQHLYTATEGPMIALSFVWLGLTIFDLVWGLNRPFQVITYTVWALFVVDFLVKFTIAPQKMSFLRHNWLTAVSLALPTLRVFRLFRALRILGATRTLRSVTLLRVLTSLNRSMGALAVLLGRRGLGYAIIFTVFVTLAGAAGMLQFERYQTLQSAGYTRTAQTGGGINSYGDALWWTAMTMTTLGSDYSPTTLEGRLLGWLLSLYALAIFGYITASVASFLIGKDVPTNQATTDMHGQLARLTAQIESLQTRIDGLTEHMGGDSEPTRPAGGHPDDVNKAAPR